MPFVEQRTGMGYSESELLVEAVGSDNKDSEVVAGRYSTNTTLTK